VTPVTAAVGQGAYDEIVPITIGAKRESNFTDPIGMLGDCHRRIEMFLGVLVRVAETARGGGLTEEQRGAFDNALRYFREAAPRHTADEEESLFPRLQLPADLMARIESLEEDHETADRLHAEVDRFGQAWLASGELPETDAARLVTILGQLRELYRRHIAAEDNEVFPAAAKILSGEDRQAIGREMASRRGVPV
jgi:hemerythrin-like domain-containing protein